MVFMNQPNDLERLEETIAVLGDDALIRQLTASEEDLAAGRTLRFRPRESGPVTSRC